MSSSELDSASALPTSRSERRYDFDALRVILFGLLIWLHYVSLCTWTQTVVPLHNNKTVMLIISVMHQWRLAALFVISGMGTAFAFSRRTWPTYLWERMVRLAVPLLFATYILLGGFVDPLDATYRFVEIFPGIGRMPYGHLWFIYNLLIYSVVLTPLFVYVRRHPDGRLVQRLRALLNMRFGTGLVLVPALLFTVSDVFFKPWVAGGVGMWWEFPRYFLFFGVGYLLISARDEYSAALERLRYALIPLTLIMTLVYVRSRSIFGVPELAVGGWVNQGQPAFSVGSVLGLFALELHAWLWCLLIFAWAAALLNRPNRVFAYLNQAVYCSYIVHINMAIVAAAIVYQLQLGYTGGLLVGLVIQTVLCLVFFEIAKRSWLGQVLFGIKVQGVARDELTATATDVWQRRFVGAVSTSVLCGTIVVMIVFGWQFGKRHFVQPLQSREVTVSEIVAVAENAELEPARHPQAGK